MEAPLDTARLREFLQSHETLLTERLFAAAESLGLALVTADRRPSWLQSVRGLSESLVKAAKAVEGGLSWDDAAAAEFGLIEARAHRLRGLETSSFLAMLKEYRSAYIQLSDDFIEDRGERRTYRDVILRFYDAVELSIVRERIALSSTDLQQELEVSARDLEMEKITYRSIFEDVGEAVLLLTLDGTTLISNKSAKALFSCCENGKRCMPFEDEIHDFVHNDWVARQFERTLTTCVGQRVFSVQLRRLFSVTGAPTAITLMLVDVTSRKVAEDRLKATEWRYEQLFRNMVDGFAHYRVVRGDDGTVSDCEYLEVNEAFATAVRLPASSLVGKRVLEVFPDRRRSDPNWTETCQQVVDRGEVVSQEYFSEVAKCWYVRRLYSTGEETFAVLFTDISAVKRQEELLEVQVAERTSALQTSLGALERANHVKDDFLASMSHELRTPLNSVIGFSGILLAGMAGDLNEEQARQVLMVRSAGERLLSLVNDVLDLSRAEAGYAEVRASEFDLVSLTEKAVESMRPIIGNRDVSLVVEFDDLVIPVWNDEDKVAQILLNLVSNAIKFTEEGTVRVRSSVSRDGLWAVVAVTDTGSGITPDEMAHIFERFHRARLTAPLAEGAGLGLAISRRFAEVLGGDIRVESTPGVGSTFTVRIPVRHESVMP